MKKCIALLLCLLLCGCAGPGEPADERPRVVATIFPLYDWTRELIGDSDGVQLSLLVDGGVDMHSYQPTVDDMIAISSCDLLLCVGGESDAWLEDAVRQAQNQDMTVVRLLDLLGDAAREEELVEGMQPEEAAEAESEDDGGEYDEHVWLSLKNARTLCGVIADELERLDPVNADGYAARGDDYSARLEELDARYAQTVDASTKSTLLFCDRFPFRYLVEDYGLDYYAAFPGCSAETEASFETVLFLARRADELGLTTALTLEGSQHDVAQTVSANTGGGLKVVALDSMQSTSAGDGVTYLDVMEKNLASLKLALQ